jgi:hypothetical protein
MKNILDKKTADTFKISDNAYNQYKVSLSGFLNVLVDEKILKRSFKPKGIKK